MGALPPIGDERVLVAFETSDDGAVYQLSDDLAVVQSLDVLTPVVDSARDFGRIAAANAVSDIYAMGADPRFAISFAGFPKSKLPMSVLADIVRGAGEVCTLAHMPIIGGHTIDDAEPKFGLAVTGVVHPSRIVTNAGASPGEQLVLTKPIGSGVITTAAKNDRGATAEEVAGAVEVMATLNDRAARAMLAAGVRGATDVTGFGLLGHLHELAAGSGCAAELRLERIPWLPGARRLAAADVFPGGSRRNLGYVRPHLRPDEGIGEPDLLLLADAQTSGGLLMAVAPERLESVLAALDGAAWHVGALTDGAPGCIWIR